MSLEVPIILLVLAFPIYFLTKWVLIRLRFGTEKNRNYLALFSTALLSPLLYIGIIVVWFFSVSYYSKVDFDKEEWTKNKEVRYQMSDDIIKNEVLIGKTKKEIIELLGEDSYFYDENHIAYELGFVPGLFNVDIAVLDLYFENGKVIKVEQHET
jgi:hypothetical protein